MSATQRIICAFSHCFYCSLPPISSSCSSFKSPPSLFLPFSRHYRILARSLPISPSPMPRNQVERAGRHKEPRWKEEPQADSISSATADATGAAAESVTHRLAEMRIAENIRQTSASAAAIQFGDVQPASQFTAHSPKTVEKHKSYEAGVEAVDKVEAGVSSTKNTISALSGNNLLENFTVDNSTYSLARIRATFYPKFENEKSDQEIRTRMIEMVSKGLATLEVSLKHSGSLFMYAGHKGGAYAKNSFGNIYTAVGVFVLGRMFREAWGTEASKKQVEFNEFLERNHMCISMELVTAVLGDHGQRPNEDFVVVTAVTELGKGKPKFYSTPEIIAFCRKWRIPTNHVWLFSTRKSVSSFFAAFDALCEEGTATPVCKALDEIADISIPGSKDHAKAQGEILEGLVARIVPLESSSHMEKVLKEVPPPPADGVGHDFGPNLRELCAANRSDEKQQIKALLDSVGSSFCPDHSDWFGPDGTDCHSRNADRSVLSKFLQANPADYSTRKMQEIVRLMREKRYPAAFKCYHNFHEVDAMARDNLFYRMVIHVHSDSAFRRYQKEMRHKPGLWPLYRGFFVDINLFKANKERSSEISKANDDVAENSTSTSGNDLADDDANLMVKLKFLTYKLRTFLIRNGLSILFKEGPGAYKAYYLRQMKIWGTSSGKQRELSKMLDEWAVHIRRKYGNKQLSSSIYLSEAEPFLEQFAKRSPQNQALVGSAGNLVRSEDFMAIVEEGRDEEGDLEVEREILSPKPSTLATNTVAKQEGLIVFFPGIPGCAKSALCKELLNSPDLFGDDRPVHSLMGDLIKGKYWQKVADERRKKPYSIMLADKNAPNEEVWRQVEDMCNRTRASAVPVVPESEGTDSNPYSLDALAVFMFRVLQRVNHPGSLDKASPNAGYVLLMFYHLYEGKSRREFESELIERFGSLVKMPLLKSDRNPLPQPVQSILEEGISLYQLHNKRHGRLESTKGSYAKEWTVWEKRLREILSGNAEYLNSIQVPFEVAVKQVSEQLRNIAKGDYTPPDTEKRKFGTIVFAALSLPVTEIQDVLKNMASSDPSVEAFLEGKSLKNLQKAHVTLAHKRSHGVKAVADYGEFLHEKVPVELKALLFSDEMAAFEACPGSLQGDKRREETMLNRATLFVFLLVLCHGLEMGTGSVEKEDWSSEKQEREERWLPVESEDWFLLQRSKQVVKTDAGEMKVTQGYGGRVVDRPMHIGFINMEPKSLFIPQYLDSSLILFIRRGEAELGFIDDDKLAEKRLKTGDVYRISAGSVFYLVNTGRGQRLHIICSIDPSENLGIGFFQSFYIGGGANPPSVLSGFEPEVIRAALNTSGFELRKILMKQQEGPIVFVDDSHAPSLWTKFLQLREQDRLQHLKKMVDNKAESDDDEEKEKEAERTDWPWRKLLNFVFGNVNKKTEKRDIVKYPDSCNLYDREPDFSNRFGWSVALDSTNYPPLKRSGIGVYLVNLTAGSMMAPHVNPRATEYGIVLYGTGSVQVVLPNGTAAMNAKVREGDVFFVPRYFPFCQIASRSGPLEFVGFTTSARKNRPQFLAGGWSLLNTLMGPELAASFGVSEKTMRRLVKAQHESVILPAERAAPGDVDVRRREEGDEREE